MPQGCAYGPSTAILFSVGDTIFMCLTRIRSIQDTATIALDRYDILYAGEKIEAGVGVSFYIDMDFASPQRCETCS
jgi:hypothetical protein